MAETTKPAPIKLGDIDPGAIYTRQELAAAFRCSRKSIERAVAEGRLKETRIAGLARARRYFGRDVLDFIGAEV